MHNDFGPWTPSEGQLHSEAHLRTLHSHFSQPSRVDGMMLKKEEAWALQYPRGYAVRKHTAETWLTRNDGSYGLFSSNTLSSQPLLPYLTLLICQFLFCTKTQYLRLTAQGGCAKCNTWLAFLPFPELQPLLVPLSKPLTSHPPPWERKFRVTSPLAQKSICLVLEVNDSLH